MRRQIVDFRLDAEEHRVAELECRHSRHVRHNPPLVSRPWMLTKEGRHQRVGAELDCKLCADALVQVPG